jgi:hypothetical protein
MTTLTLLEQLNKSPKWAEFEKWYKEQHYELPLYDNHPSLFGFIELEFEFQRGVFEKFIRVNATYTTSVEKHYLYPNGPSKSFDSFEELVIYYFNLPTAYWEWYWGTDQNDLTKHSEKIKFTDFDRMKNFSAKHSYSCEHLKPNYWSSYDVIEI